MRYTRMAEKLGLSSEELKAELDSGKSLREIAEEKGVEFTSKKRSRRNR